MSEHFHASVAGAFFCIIFSLAQWYQYTLNLKVTFFLIYRVIRDLCQSTLHNKITSIGTAADSAFWLFFSLDIAFLNF